MGSAWKWFVAWGWLYAMIAIGLSLVVLLARNWKKWSWLDRLGALAVIVLVLHVWEEWVLPGGFHYIYNLGSAYPDRYPMSQLTDMITNLGGALLGLVVLLVWGFKAEAGIAVGIFSLFEFVVHVFLASKSLKVFGPAGQTLFYAPGLATAAFGFLPVAIGFFLAIARLKPRPKLRQWLGGILALLCLSLVFVQAPEAALKDKDSPYAFANHGYYEQFIKR
jgi:hypothetical protein